MKILFKGQAVKNQSNINKAPIHKMPILNKIIVKHSIAFYSKAWNHRNQILYKPEKYKQYIVEWKKS